MKIDILYIGLEKLKLDNNELFEQNNINMMTTSDALTGLIEIKYKNPKLVLLNLDLIKINAFDCLRIIRQNPQYYHIKIAMISSIVNYTQIDNAFKLGADYFLIEPVTSDAIMRILENVEIQAMFKSFENIVNRYNFS